MKNKDLIAFNKLTNILLSKKFKINTKLRKCLKIILKHLNCNRGSIMIAKNDYLEIVSSTNEHIIGIKISLDQSTPAVIAYKKGEIVSVRLEKSKEQYENCNSYVIAPIKVKNEVYGVINITGKDNNEEFTNKDIKIIEKFVNSISILMKNLFLTENLKDEKKKLEHALNELQKTQKLKEELTSMIVHDFKSPLSQIMANIDILSMDKDIKEQHFDVLDAALKGCEDMMCMIQNMVDIYRFEQNKLLINKNYENINALLKDTVHKLYSLIVEKKQQIFLKLDKNLPLTMIDPMMCTRIFYNLIHNAVKYSPVSAKIFLKTKFNDKFIIIEIKNTGVSIPKNDLKKIFDKFYSILRHNESSGLGLTFVKLAVDAHNGKIFVSSKENQWTRFKILLPLVKKTQEVNSDILDLTL